MYHIDKEITEYIESFVNSPNRNVEMLRDMGEKNRIPIIMKDTEKFISWVLKTLKPQNILEIGTAIGYSAIYMAATSEDANIITIEKDPLMTERARENISAFSFENRIRVIEGDGIESLLQLQEKYKLNEIEGFDLVFIDAAKSYYREFWDIAITMTNGNAVIICDNILMRGMTASDKFDKNRKHKTSIRKMREFLSYINDMEDVTTSILAIGDGVSISTILKNKNNSNNK